MNEQSKPVAEIPYSIQGSLIGKADDFKIKSLTKKPHLPKIHTKDVPEIKELRSFISKLRKIPISEIPDEKKELLYKKTHNTWRTCGLSSLEKTEKEHYEIIIGKSLKMLRAFDEYDISKTERNATNFNNSKSTERDRQGTRHLEKNYNRSRF